MAPRNRTGTKATEKRTVVIDSRAMGATLAGEVLPLLIAGLQAMEIEFTIDAPVPWAVTVTFSYNPEDYE
jgi:hypothetical protein